MPGTVDLKPLENAADGFLEAVFSRVAFLAGGSSCPREAL